MKFEVGNYVEVKRKPTDAEYKLWANSWEDVMDDFVGKIGIVTSTQFADTYGIEVNNEWFFPAVILKKVDTAK